LAVGDRVVGFLPMADDGAAAEYVVAPAEVLAAAPASVPLADAAALPAVGLTAWQAFPVPDAAYCASPTAAVVAGRARAAPPARGGAGRDLPERVSVGRSRLGQTRAALADLACLGPPVSLPISPR
jgi:hypothetical protein